jgi:hypothetical protein
MPRILNDAMPTDDPEFFAKLPAFSQRNPPAHALEETRKVVIAQMAKEFKSIQIVGFCLGAR